MPPQSGAMAGAPAPVFIGCRLARWLAFWVIPTRFPLHENRPVWDFQLTPIRKGHAPQAGVQHVLELIKLRGVRVLSLFQTLVPLDQFKDVLNSGLWRV